MTRCTRTTNNGARCKRQPTSGSTCWQHKKRKRCKNGYRKSGGKCVRSRVSGKQRCSRGYRKNKSGVCKKKSNSARHRQSARRRSELRRRRELADRQRGNPYHGY